MAMMAGLWRRQAVMLPSTATWQRRTFTHASHVLAATHAGEATSAPPKKERLVILGSGWGAMSLLKALNQSRYEVMVVSPNTYFAMTPLLAQAATGTLELRAAMEPVRGNHNIHFYHAWTEDIDLASRTLTLMPAYPPAFRAADPLAAQEAARIPNARGGQSTLFRRSSHRMAVEGQDIDAGGSQATAEQGREYTLTFDKLVISVGAYNRTFGTPGVRENAWFLKDAQNARAIRWRILECFEQADHPELSDDDRRKLLAFVVVGGGPTGAEFAAELHDLLSTDLKRLFPNLTHLTSITIVDAAAGILNNFDASLATFAREKFARDGVRMLLERKVKAVERGVLKVEPDGDIPFGLLVWSTGICASPLVKRTTSIAKDERNQFFLTDKQLRVLSPESTPVDDVYALGDCAQIENRFLPATAQVASQKGKHLAHVLNGQMGEDPSSDERVFKHRDMGSMASLGSGSAIVDSPKAKAQGRIAWVIWRSAYTYMSLSWRNRLLVPFFWTINKIFGRDLTRF